tara:strand:+ start:1332 stop:1679 length:348 start_codon:yes stop_codon:yes gene_type:complete
MSSKGLAIILDKNSENQSIVTPITINESIRKNKKRNQERIKDRIKQIYLLKFINKHKCFNFDPTYYILKLSRTLLSFTIYYKLQKIVYFTWIIAYNIYSKCCLCSNNRIKANKQI